MHSKAGSNLRCLCAVTGRIENSLLVAFYVLLISRQLRRHDVSLKAAPTLGLESTIVFQLSDL